MYETVEILGMAKKLFESDFLSRIEIQSFKRLSEKSIFKNALFEIIKYHEMPYPMNQPKEAKAGPP